MPESTTSRQVEEIPLAEAPFAYVQNDVIVALVNYYDTREPGTVYAAVYTLAQGMPADELRLANPYFQQESNRLRQASRPVVVSFEKELANFDGLYRIDDDRPGKKMSYLVWLPEPDAKPPVPAFVPGAIYGFYPNGQRDYDQQKGEFPPSLTRAELDVMMSEAGIKPLTSPSEHPGNPEPGSKLPKVDLRVWDMAAMFRE